MVDCLSLAGEVGFLGLLVVEGLVEAEDIINRSTFLYLCDDEMPELIISLLKFFLHLCKLPLQLTYTHYYFLRCHFFTFIANPFRLIILCTVCHSTMATRVIVPYLSYFIPITFISINILELFLQSLNIYFDAEYVFVNLFCFFGDKIGQRLSYFGLQFLILKLCHWYWFAVF